MYKRGAAVKLEIAGVGSYFFKPEVSPSDMPHSRLNSVSNTPKGYYG